MSDDLSPEEKPAEAPAAGTGRRTTIMIVAAAVVVLVAIGVGIYLVAASGGEDAASDPSPPTITGTPPPDTPSSTPPPSTPPTSRPTSAAPPSPENEDVADARTTAERAMTAINERDVAAMRKLSCDPSAVGSVDSFPPQATARLAENPEITGDKATVRIELSIAGGEPTVVPVPLERRDGRWCVV